MLFRFAAGVVDGEIHDTEDLYQSLSLFQKLKRKCMLQLCQVTTSGILIIHASTRKSPFTKSFQCVNLINLFCWGMDFLLMLFSFALQNCVHISINSFLGYCYLNSFCTFHFLAILSSLS